MSEPITAIGRLNLDLDNKIGERGDLVHIPYDPDVTAVLAHLNTAYYHVHGEAFVYPKYADPVTLTSAAGAWATTGAITEVIPAGATDRPFDLHWISISDISDTMYGIVDIYAGESGSETLIGTIDLFRTSNFISEGARRIQIPQQPAGTRISCKLSDGETAADTCKVKFNGHYYG